ncbi:spore germination protein KC [Bacillus methanolicus PB1]|uniref:Spore germination protein KC n=1 Tax=Bacillus methanolicus PB1 TaxID=997296 RepID=I3E6Q9_BACMT|nr:Ger(x)C family spore germination protein [Bacillus methanolicus]EIJ82180.1 spore germination protein KC [Bacillus methanolicus PB1]
MNHKRIFLFLILTITLLLSGCWSKKELTDLAFISALGIDINEEGRYIGTFQIINPGNVAGGLQGGGGSDQSPPFNVFSATGDNIFEVRRSASSKVSRRLYFAHTNLVVISDELAKKQGITTIFDALDRDPEFRSTATVVIARDIKAADIVKTLTPIDKIPANKVIKTLKFTEKRYGEHMKVNIQEVMKSLVTPGKEPVITGFQLDGSASYAKKLENIQETAPKASPEASGLAIFKEGKLIDWFQGETARGVIWGLDKIKATDININWEGKKEAIAYQVIRQKTKVSANMKNEKPKISIHVRAEGDIGEVTVPIDLSNPRVLSNIEKALEKEIKKEIHDAIQRAQKNKSDIFGFGEALHRSDPEAWKKMKHDWSDVHFPELEVSVTVDAFIRRTGLRNKPHLSDIEMNR